MAHYKRRKARIHARSNLTSMSTWPAWWDLLFNTRPKRRKEKHLEWAVCSGQVDADEALWPPGNSKPHKYYW